MSSLALLVLLLSSLQYASAQTCTKDQLCKVVKRSVCDDKKCLTVNIADIHGIISQGAIIHDWNILPRPFTTGCPITVNFEPAPYSGVTNAVNATYGAYTGASCTELVAGSRIYSGDIDPSGGQIRKLTAEVNGVTYEDCFIYLEPNKGFIFRRWVIDSSNEPCASIYSLETKGSVKTEDDSLHTFLHNIGVDVLYEVSDCPYRY